MVSELRHTIERAAGQLETVLCRGRDLCFQALTNPAASPVNFVLGFDHPQAHQSANNSTFITSLEAAVPGPSSSAVTAEFPVLVNRQLVVMVRKYYTLAFANYQSEQPTQLDRDGETRTPCVADSLNDSPHVTRSMLVNASDAFVAVAWLCNPQLECFVSFRRRRLGKALERLDDRNMPANLLLPFVKEIVLLDLLISVCPKLKSLWDYRLWVTTQVLQRGLLVNVKAAIDPLILLSCLQRQDDVSFFIAAHNHPLNYNAWHYRRGVSALIRRCQTEASKGAAPSLQLSEYDCERVLQFLRTHNGDSSATSYLIFLLREHSASKRVGAVLAPESAKITSSAAIHKKAQIEIEAEGSGAQHLSYSPLLWKQLMLFTQEEIRRHCDKGHECMWCLRLELVSWALTHGIDRGLCSAWRVEDELAWVTAYVDGVQEAASENLLSPIAALPHAWTESSGSLAWTSYNAARYGLMLLSKLHGSNYFISR